MKMSAHDETKELIRKGDERLLGLLKLCLDFVLKNGRETSISLRSGCSAMGR